jgi:predicted enzyme related to lactoylglutathione lyase
MRFEQRLSLITLGVSDLTRSREFYREVMGWTPSCSRAPRWPRTPASTPSTVALRMPALRMSPRAGSPWRTTSESERRWTRRWPRCETRAPGW